MSGWCPLPFITFPYPLLPSAVVVVVCCIIIYNEALRSIIILFRRLSFGLCAFFCWSRKFCACNCIHLFHSRFRFFIALFAILSWDMHAIFNILCHWNNKKFVPSSLDSDEYSFLSLQTYVPLLTLPHPSITYFCFISSKLIGLISTCRWNQSEPLR